MKTILGAIIGLAIIGGLIVWGMGKDDTTVVINPPGTTSPGTTPTPSPAATPAAPLVTTSATASPSDTAVVVLGTVNPNGALTSYWYEFGTTANLGSKTNTQGLGSGFTSISAPAYITGLVTNTTYYYKLVAENRYGRVSGNQFTFQTTSGSPAPTGSAPTTKSLSASGISRTTANLNGEVTPNRASTQYWFEYGKTTELGNTSAFSNVGNGTSKSTVSISLSDLEPATTYYFRLNAQNQFGTINGSILNFKTSGPAVPTSPAVKTNSATNVDDSSVTLRGTVNPNGAETKYWFEYSTDSLLGSVLLTSTAQTSVGAGTGTISVTDDISGLNGNTTYYYRIVAENSQGINRGDKVTFKTK